MHLRPGRSLVVACIAAASVGALGVAAASAAGTPSAKPAASPTATSGGYPFRIRTLNKSVRGPLQIAVGPDKRVYVADDARGTLFRIGDKKRIFTAPKGYEVAGVDVRADGAVAFTWGSAAKERSYLTILRKGHKAVTANLGAFEAKHNPDSKVTYGIDHPTDCQVAALKKAGAPANYPGGIDTHPYSVVATRAGWVVADAAGNDLLLVSSSGKVKLLRLMPRIPVTITAEVAKAFGITDSCVLGAVYNFEPVPTDVEAGHDGALYATTLPGGIVPNAGGVWRLTPRSHHLRELASGFNLATNLAITPSGRILVTEYGSGRISTIVNGRPSTVLDLPNVVAVEFAGHAVYASTAQEGEEGPSGPGSVVRIDVRW